MLSEERWYVSVVDGKRKGLLYGPLATREEAEGAEHDVRRVANRMDARAPFYGYGVAKWTGASGTAPTGVLNDLVNACRAG